MLLRTAERQSPWVTFWAVVRQPGVILLTWPTNSQGYALQQNTDLNRANWVAAFEAISPAGTNYQSTIQTANGPRFFRLQHP